MSEICILYCLTKREMTIYSVKKHISELFGAFTKPSHGTIHPALKKLAEIGYLSVQETLSDGGKKSSYYAITEKGKKLFTELMLSDFSDNPSVSINEVNIRIASMGALTQENRKLFVENCLRFLDLYVVQNKRAIADEYSSFDDYQKAVTAQTIKNTESLMTFLKEIRI